MKIYVYAVSIKNISDILTEQIKTNNLQKLKNKGQPHLSNIIKLINGGS